MADRQKTAKLILDIQTDNPNVYTLLLATEPGERGRQHKFRFEKTTTVEAELPPGKYFFQVAALEHRPVNFIEFLDSGSEQSRKLRLEPEKEPRCPTFEERLKAYGLSPRQAVESLKLEEREHRVIRNREDTPGLVHLKAKSLKDVKRFIGAPSDVFSHDEPRFGVVKVDDEIIRRLRENKLDAEDRVVLNDLVREYLHGNEKANAQFIEELQVYIVEFLRPDFWFHIFRTLTIPAGATYEFGPGTLVLDELNIHRTGKLVPVGQCKFDIGVWREFT